MCSLQKDSSNGLSQGWDQLVLRAAGLLGRRWIGVCITLRSDRTPDLESFREGGLDVEPHQTKTALGTLPSTHPEGSHTLDISAARQAQLGVLEKGVSIP